MKTNKSLTFWQTVNLFTLGLCVFLLIGVIVVNGVSLLLSDTLAAHPAALLVLNDLGLYLLGLPLALLIWHFIPNGPAPIHLRKPLSPGLFCGYGMFTMALGYASSFVTEGLSSLLDLPESSVAQQMLPLIPDWASLLLIALAPAVLEEAIFRGILYQKFARFGEKPFVLLSGALFAMFHGNLSQMLFAFMLGCCFALVVYRTGCIVYSMMLHFLINFMSACIITPLMDNLVFSVLLGFWMIACLAAGIVFFAMHHKGMRLRPGHSLPVHPVASAILNPGMITWIIFTLLMVVLSLFL